jgi:hypothetical protein
MKSIFEKLNLKAQTQILVINAPPSFEPELTQLSAQKILREAKKVKSIEFALAFATTQTEVDNLSEILITNAVADAVLWIAYPKQTSKKYKCTFNRDTGWKALGDAGFEPVRQVAIDEDWSALRFRRVEYIKSFTRAGALSPAGKARIGGR